VKAENSISITETNKITTVAVGNNGYLKTPPIAFRDSQNTIHPFISGN